MDDRLYRSQRDRVLAGVAGGLAEYWDADPSLVRLLWVLVAIFTGGLALIVYVIMAIVVPDESVVFPAGRPVDPASLAGAATAPDGTPLPLSPYQARRARRAARRAARGDRDGRGGLLIGGAVLILIGSWFLLREWLPGLDFDRIWPVALIALGVLVLLLSLRRPSRLPGGTP